MFDQVMDNYRKAVESTMQLQRELLRQWTGPWPMVPGAEGFKLPGFDEADGLRKKYGQGLTEMLNRHRESLDAQYKAGIKTIEEAFRLNEAKDPQQLRKLVEELWRQSFDCLKTVVETQMKDVQAATEKWLDTAGKVVAKTKV
jgi:hypothetical protein